MSTDIVISFDTTGSMSPCIAEVRRKVRETVERLFYTIPDLRIGIIAHGDYCDGSFCISQEQLTNNKDLLIRFLNWVPNTSGGDSDECYELVLYRLNSWNWEADNRAVILIADALPHAVGYRYKDIRNEHDWREQAKELASKRVSIYAVEALGDRNSRSFYEPLADYTNGRKLSLNQFSDAVETIIAISYHSSSDKELLDGYKNELESSFKMNRNLAAVFNKLGNYSVKVESDKSGLIPVSPFRFQMLNVDNLCVIKDFVESVGTTFRKGRGFYQFTKSEIVQEHKEVILRNKITGDMFTGAEARNFIGLPFGERGTIRPKLFDDYEVYIQSTSYNRKLIPNTKFLYENDGASL
jgi:hypothetical protein